MKPELSLSPRGLSLFADSRAHLFSTPDWLELAIKDEASKTVKFKKAGTTLVGKTKQLSVSASIKSKKGQVTPHITVTLKIANLTKNPVAFNAKWRLPLADQNSPTRWLIPALFYKDNAQQFPGGPPALWPKEDLKENRSPWWLFRSDLMAVPMAMGWAGGVSTAIVMDEHPHGHMSSLGFDNRPGQRALLGSWPYREEPRQRSQCELDPTKQSLFTPVITYFTLSPGNSVEFSFHLFTGSSDPHAFAPVLRESFEWFDPAYPLKPWYPLVEGADHAAHGLFHYYYDPEFRALWETCSYERYFAKNDRFQERFDMHTGFVSGIPYAFAMLVYGQQKNRPDISEAGKNVIDFCCENLTEYGTFWSKFSKEEGWTTGWPSPQTIKGSPTMGSKGGELQARTIAEATLFAARGVKRVKSAQSRDLWTRAVTKNLDYVLKVMRPDGNTGASYQIKDGSVAYWDGEEGIHWISAFIEGYRITQNEKYLQAAIKAGTFFEASVNDAYMSGAPEGSHLLVTSEDAQNATMAYTLLWEETKSEHWKDVAMKSFDLFMTFRWQYNTVFPEMTILDQYDYRTKGLDISSPNNVHLHPFGPLVLEEMVKLWETTGDSYLIRQIRNNIQGCHQMMAQADGVFDARRGMMTERWHQTPSGVPKGGTLQLAHSWCSGCLLLADNFLAEYGSVMIDGRTGELVALEALGVTGSPKAWRVMNQWKTNLTIQVVIREAHGQFLSGKIRKEFKGGTQRVSLTIKAGETVKIQWLKAKVKR